MGIRLMTEVMDRAPATLTQREHKVLIILAEDAIDGEPGELDGRGREKRVTRQPPASPVMLRRARVSRSQLYAVVAALVAKGCLQRVTAGGGGHPARYRIPAFCVPENWTQTPAVSRFPGHSVSRFAKDTDRPQNCYGTLNGARRPAEVIAPGLAEQVRDRNGAAPPQSLRDHDGPENDGPDDQRRSVPVTHQSQAADRNAREDAAEDDQDQGYRDFKAARARGEFP